MEKECDGMAEKAQDLISPLPSTLGMQSIYSLMKLHPRKRLIVIPILWTDLHLTLLGCHFKGETDTDIEGVERVERVVDANVHADQQLQLQYDADELYFRRAKQFVLSGNAGMKEIGITSLFDTPGSPLKSWHRTDSPTYLRFRFEGRRVLTMPCVLFRCNKPVSGPDSEPVPVFPYLGYLHSSEIAELRRDCLRQRSNNFGLPNPIAKSIQRARVRKIAPRDDHYRDPYLAAVLIAMAQEQRSRQRLHRSTKLRKKAYNPNYRFTVHLLLAESGNCHDVNLYTAHPTIAFLERFDFPTQAPPVPTDLDILHRRIPHEPHDSFLQRLLQSMEVSSDLVIVADTTKPEKNVRVTTEANNGDNNTSPDRNGRD